MDESWECAWRKRGYDVAWVDEIRMYVGICRHCVNQRRHEGLLFALTIQEMDEKIRSVSHRADTHPVVEEPSGSGVG